MLENASVKNILSTSLIWVLNTGIKILISLVILLISCRIINLIARKIEKRGENKKFDKTLAKTLAYIFRIGLKAAVVICLVAYLGVDTSGLAAAVASLGVGIGLAVNGALSNLAGGVLILLTRPFRVDDYIDAEGVSGTVEDIHIVCTKLRTPDNKVIYVPNGSLANGNITNYSEKPIRRVDFSFKLSYRSNIEAAKSSISKVLSAHSLILKNPDTFVKISEYGDCGITLTARAWTATEDYWTVRFDVIEAIKAEFDRCGIEIPYPQLDVHIKNE